MSTAIDFYPTNWLARLVKLWAVEDGYRTLRFRWGEVSLRPWLGLWYSVYHESAHIGIGFGPFAVFINAPMLITQKDGTEDWNASYGFTLHRDRIALNWRCWYKGIEWPWTTEWMKTEVLSYGGMSVWSESRGDSAASGLSKDNALAVWSEKHDAKAAEKAKHSKKFPYRYTLLSGEVQEREATVSISRMTWGWPRLGLPITTRTCIEVEFSDEVGERTGSWKGGTIGCGYDMQRGETPALCLQRMERERVFR